MVKDIKDLVRRQVEECDSIDGFLIHNSICGGTGSGLSELLLTEIASDYPRSNVHSNMIIPSGKKKSHIMVEPYNAMLSAH